MDERKNIIRELEEKKNADTEERNRLLEALGEALIKRIGETDPFKEKTETSSGDTPGIVLDEYRQIQKEIAASSEIIKSLEEDTQKLKDVDAGISEKEKEKTRLDKELEELSGTLGKQLLPDPEFKDLAGSSKQQEEDLLVKIEELEKKLDESGEQGKGFLAWLGKNAQMVMSKNLLQRNRSSLQRLYRSVGEKFLSMEQEKSLEGEAAQTLEKARELKERINDQLRELTELRGERKRITDIFGIEGSPARRISGIEKRISHIKLGLPGIYLRFGTLAVEKTEQTGPRQEKLSSFIKEDDSGTIEKAELLNTRIAERDLRIRKINASMNIDKKKAEIEKLNKAIEGQKEKITFANEAIAGYESQIAESEQQIEELETFLKQND